MTASDERLPGGNQPRTVEFWQNIVQCSCYPFPIVSYGGSDGFVILMGGDYQSIQVEDGSSDVLLPAPHSFNVTGWHLIDVTLDGSTASLYVDGQPASSAPFSAHTTVPGGGLVLWKNTEAATYYDDLAIYPCAVGASDIAEHFSVAAGGVASSESGGCGGGVPAQQALDDVRTALEALGGGPICIPCLANQIGRTLAAFGFPVDSADGNMYDTSTDL